MFQYPLFRIELLSQAGHKPRTIFPVVSISALSDRIAQRASVADPPARQTRFNIRSFGSNCSAWIRSRVAGKYSSFNIRSFGSNCSAVSKNGLMDLVWGFNIRSFGSNCSARKACEPRRTNPQFQYPLFRIELLSDIPAVRRCR